MSGCTCDSCHAVPPFVLKHHLLNLSLDANWYDTSAAGIVRTPFREVRPHLGLARQQQWSMLAIARSSPCLLGLFSLVVLMAHALRPDHLPTRQAVWYPKTKPHLCRCVGLC